jgi:hypothetical protein
MTPEIRRLLDRARQEVYALSAGTRRWSMSIPPRADDSDMLLCEAFDKLEAALLALPADLPPGAAPTHETPDA